MNTPPAPNFDMKVKLLTKDAVAPTKAHDNDLGWDLYSNEEVIIPPFKRYLVSTGVAIQFPPNVGGIVKDRSGFATNSGGFVHAGVIDPDYRGEIKVLFWNSEKNPLQIRKGDKIAQMFLMPVFIVSNFEVVEELDDTERGEKGFGSSGS